jgi:hypothetical protein
MAIAIDAPQKRLTCDVAQIAAAFWAVALELH